MLRQLFFLPVSQPKAMLYVAAVAACALTCIGVARREDVRCLTWLGTAGAALFIAASLIYLASPLYEDHVESSMAAIAWLWREGAPVYHAPDAAPRYSYLYGPLTFILNGCVMVLTGPGIFGSKLGGVLACSLSIACVAATASRLGFRGVRLFGAVAAFASVCALFGTLAYWNRPDSFLLTLSTVAVLLATYRPSLVTAALFGLVGGLMVNLKLYAPLFAAAPASLALLGSRRPLLFALPLLLTGAIAAAAPFGMGDVNLANYLQLIRFASEHGLTFGEFVGSVGMALLCCGPPALLTLILRPASDVRLGWVRALFLAVTALVIVPASKIGAGPHHLLPLWPVGLWLSLLAIRDATARPQLRGLPRGAWLVWAPAAPLLWFAASAQIGVIADATSYWREAEDAAREARAVAEDPALRPVQVVLRAGPGLSGKVQPVFLGQGLLLDDGALMDLNQTGLPLPAATIAAIRTCSFPTFLVPAGTPPLSDRSYYHEAPIFGAELRDSFLASYAFQSRRGAFDVWRCKRG